MTINDNEQKESKNILFLTLLDFDSLEERNIYTDLLREIRRHGNKIFVISPSERKNKNRTHLIREHNSTILKLRIGNIQKTNNIEKGISTVLIEPQFKLAIRKFFNNVRFDLVLYSTPPISFVDVVKYVKMRDNAKTYLLLKDIFPQNALDLGMLGTTGLKGVLYNHFRKQEKRLYRVSDRIGCMSQANVEYVIRHNRELNPAKVEVCPNCIEVIDKSIENETRMKIRKKYKIPINKKVFIYGGNLGKPQGISFIIKCLKLCKDIKEVYFLIVGDGTEYKALKEYVEKSGQENIKLLKWLPKEEYDYLTAACDVGMIFLDNRFTIPNFPSRVLSYMQAKLPVLAATDSNTDIGNVVTGIDINGKITHNAFGWWCKSDDAKSFVNIIKCILEDELQTKGRWGYKYLKDNYSVEKAYAIILSQMI